MQLYFTANQIFLDAIPFHSIEERTPPSHLPINSTSRFFQHVLVCSNYHCVHVGPSSVNEVIVHFLKTKMRSWYPLLVDGVILMDNPYSDGECGYGIDEGKTHRARAARVP